MSSRSHHDTWIAVGRIGRPHGLAGAFVVEEASESPERLAVGAVVHVAGEPATVVEAKRSGGRLVVRLDRRVERGARLEVLRSELPEPEPDAYYVVDLIGLAVTNDRGRPVGTVAGVEPGVANDVLELDTGLQLPLVEECVLEIDLERGTIVVAEGFLDPEAIAGEEEAGADPAAGPPR